MTLTAVNPESLAKPRGYSHGMKGHGDVLFVAGQIGWDRGAVLVSADLVAQFGQASGGHQAYISRSNDRYSHEFYDGKINSLRSLAQG